MGLFSFLKKKNKSLQGGEVTSINDDQDIVIDTALENEEYHGSSKSDQVSYIKANCDQILESSRQLEESKVEYEAVTSYLNDIQKIDQVSDEEKEDLLGAAEMITKLTKERSRYQNMDNSKISSGQFKNIERYESEIPAEIKKIQGYEAYNSVIKTDMRHLEGEKGALLYRKKEIIYQQKYLKNLAIITSVLVVTLFVLFFVVSYIFKKDMLIPFVLTIIMAAVSSVYIFYEAGRNRSEVKVVESKLTRAVELLNKVKIKYVNNTSCLEYSYSKYMVKSAVELLYLWEQYIKAKEEERRYRKNTELLHRYNEILIDEMKELKVVDPEVWIYQAEALINSKEMVEIRHRLNVRRQKLRKQIDYNSSIRENGLGKIKDLLEAKADSKDEIVRILSEYNINI